MAERKKSHTILWIGLAGLAAFGIYAYMQSSAKPWTLAANAAEVATITSWINSMGAPASTAWMSYFQNSATQSDIDNLSTLITQYWNLQQPPTGDLTAFYVNLSAKITG